jgi:hypothetical protein
MGFGNRCVVFFLWGVNGLFHNNYWRGRLKEVERGRHVAHGRQRRWETLKLRDTIEEPHTDKVIILKLILKKTMQVYEVDLSGSG